jgi:hypothetical protein
MHLWRLRPCLILESNLSLSRFLSLFRSRGTVRSFCLRGKAAMQSQSEGEPALIAFKPANIRSTPALGSPVRFVSLAGRSDLNGAIGRVLAFDEREGATQ